MYLYKQEHNKQTNNIMHKQNNKQTIKFWLSDIQLIICWSTVDLQIVTWWSNVIIIIRRWFVCLFLFFFVCLLVLFVCLYFVFFLHRYIGIVDQIMINNWSIYDQQVDWLMINCISLIKGWFICLFICLLFLQLHKNDYYIINSSSTDHQYLINC